MGLEKIHILFLVFILWLIFTLFAIWHSKQKKKEFEIQMTEIEKTNEILRKINRKLDKLDEKEQLEKKQIDEFEELHKQLKGRG